MLCSKDLFVTSVFPRLLSFLTLGFTLCVVLDVKAKSILAKLPSKLFFFLSALQKLKNILIRISRSPQNSIVSTRLNLFPRQKTMIWNMCAYIASGLYTLCLTLSIQVVAGIAKGTAIQFIDFYTVGYSSNASIRMQVVVGIAKDTTIQFISLGQKWYINSLGNDSMQSSALPPLSAEICTHTDYICSFPNGVLAMKMPFRKSLQIARLRAFTQTSQVYDTNYYKSNYNLNEQISSFWSN